ncbi:MAG: AAA family ATPase [Actinomycetia bacterium]|nr:AAA family ATPase [Actinomycetes bacterium]
MSKKLRNILEIGAVRMRIKKIKFKNYRQLRETELNLEKNNSNDLHLVIGKNGTGKTNILNAVNWCFYNDEPNLTIEQQRLPILNTNVINDINKESKYKEVSVEILMESDSIDYSFTRTAVFIVSKTDKPINERAIHESTRFEIEVIDKDERGSNIRTYEYQDAEDFVENLIPKSVRDFYYFDGERLDNYFREATSKNIKHSIFILSQIELLERLDFRVGNILRDYTREAVDRNPAIEKFHNDISIIQNDLEEVDLEITECIHEINKAKDEIGKCNEKLTGLPNTRELEVSREQLKESKEHKTNRLKEKIEEKNNIIFEDGIKIMLFPVIRETLNIIKEKRKKNEIPPNIKSEVLEEIMEKGFCKVCGRELDKGSRIEITKLIKEKRIVSEVGHKLEDIEDYLRMFSNSIESYLPNLRKVSEDIKELNMDLEGIGNEITLIDKKLSGYNIKDINISINTRNVNEKLFTNKTEYLGVLKNRKKRNSIKLIGAEKLLEKELKKQDETLEVREKILFCKNLLNVLRKTKSKMIALTRKEIGEKTKEIFFDLIWKKGDFKDVFVDEDYMINLIDRYGNPCLGAISRAEKLLLSLSFTYALHDVSGFNSAFVIDTPVSPTDDLNRENLGKTFAQISKEKQLLLLFIPTEYSAEISKTLDSVASNKFETRFSNETKETTLEAI